VKEEWIREINEKRPMDPSSWFKDVPHGIAPGHSNQRQG